MLPFIAGFSLGFGLIISLGPQNLFLIKQSVRQDRHITCAILCCLCDALLIILSCLGLGYLIIHHPWLQNILLILGSGFLIVYGSLSLYKGIKGLLKPHAFRWSDQVQTRTSLKKVILMTLSFSLLNPQAIIDTMIIVGGSAVRYQGAALVHYAAGLIFASCCWFALVATLASLGAFVLKKPVFWSLLEILSAGIMGTVACFLIKTLVVHLGM